MVPAPLFMHAFDQLLPDVPGKVQVYIGDGTHIVGEKTLQREVVFQGVDVRQADQVAHQHGHRRTAASSGRALFQGYLHVAQAKLYHDLPGHLYDFVVDQEKPRQVVPIYQTQLFVQPVLHPIGDAAVAALGGLEAQVFQEALGSEPFRHRVIGEAVPHVPGDIEAAPVGDTQSVFNGLGALQEQLRHFLRRLEVEMPVGPALPVGFFQALVVADGHQGVLEPVAFRDVVVNVIGRDWRDAVSIRQVHQPPDAWSVSLDQVVLQFHEDVGRAEPV